MPAPVEKRYAYAARSRFLILAQILVMVLVTGLFLHQALTAEGGHGRYRWMTSSTFRLFMWIAAASAAIMIPFFLVSLYRSFGPPRCITLSPTHLSAPRSVASGKLVQVPLLSVLSLESPDRLNGKCVIIKYPGGILEIWSYMFTADYHFERFIADLEQHIQDARAAHKIRKESALMKRYPR